jgi:very-short-patch-repair endonuclease
MTDAERRLWSVLRLQQLKNLKFRRQAAIGKFVVDFVCFDRKRIIELDGGQHNDVSVKLYDNTRTAWLESQGFRVLRFWNHDVFENAEVIADAIWNAMGDAAPAQAPPPTPTHPTQGREVS